MPERKSAIGKRGRDKKVRCLRSLSVLDTHLLCNGIEVEVGFVHRFSIVVEAALEEVDLISGVESFLRRHGDVCETNRLRRDEV